MGIFVEQRILDNGSSHSWSAQCGSRPSIKTVQPSHGVDVGQDDFQEDHSALLCSGNRLACLSFEPPSTPLYVSGPRPWVDGSRCFSAELGRWKSFIHPPVVLLSRIIQKVRQDKATTLLVAPNWTGQPWYPELCEMLIDHPLQLPIRESLLTLPFRPGMTHPLWRSLRLTVWPISGSAIEQQAFRRKLSRFSSHPGPQPPRKGTVPPGILGPSGVPVMDCVQFQHL